MNIDPHTKAFAEGIKKSTSVNGYQKRLIELHQMINDLSSDQREVARAIVSDRRLVSEIVGIIRERFPNIVLDGDKDSTLIARLMVLNIGYLKVFATEYCGRNIDSKNCVV